jgi:hypothetical protein
MIASKQACFIKQAILSNKEKRYRLPPSSFKYKKLPPFTLAAFELAIHCSNLLGGRLRPPLDHAARARTLF